MGQGAADVFLETGRKDIICPVPGGMRRKRAAELFGAGVGLRRLSDREKTLLIDRLRPAYSPGSLACLPGIAPSGHLLPPRPARR